MGREYERLFGALPGRVAPAYLCERVFGAVSRERVRFLRTRLVFSSCAALGSLAGIALALPALIAAMTTTGFSSYASLVFSDSTALLGISHTFLLTLLESLPGPEIAVTLFFVATLIQSLRVLAASSVEWVWGRAVLV